MPSTPVRRILRSITLVVWIVVLAVGQVGVHTPLGQASSPETLAQAGNAVRRVAAERVGLLETNTLFGVYGRAFGVAPVLGRLGSYKSFDMMAADIQPWVKQIREVNDQKGVIPGVHLIYAMAVPCEPSESCLDYLEAAVKNIVEDYIKPAAQRGWVVVLDTQLGRSDPVAQISRMIERGYLKYDNVHVAIDPEFHVYPDRLDPGVPIGTVNASQVNAAQRLLDDYVRTENLKTRKILIVHQFGDANVRDGVPFMIEDKKTLQVFENVELVINADGFGPPAIKVRKYNLMTDARVYPFIRFRGIKLFFPNPWERHHDDTPPLTVDQIFGLKSAPGDSEMATKPNVVIIA